MNIKVSFYCQTINIFFCCVSEHNILYQANYQKLIWFELKFQKFRYFNILNYEQKFSFYNFTLCFENFWLFLVERRKKVHNERGRDSPVDSVDDDNYLDDEMREIDKHAIERISSIIHEYREEMSNYQSHLQGTIFQTKTIDIC